MSLKSLAYTDDEIAKRKEGMDKCCTMPSDYVGPKYPWGLELTFDNAVLEKMGKSATDFKPGSDLPITGTLRITGMNINENEDGTKHQSVRAVLTAIDDGMKGKTAAETAEQIYDKKD